MNIIKITEIITEILSKHDLKPYSIKTKMEFKEHVLEILIDTESITYDVLEPIHLEVLDAINDLLPDDYLLEMSSVGIERPLHSLEEVNGALGKYIYLETDEFVVEGTLDSITDETLHLKYFEKGKPKKLDVKYSDIKFIRKAVKL